MSDKIINQPIHLIPKINFSAKIINKKNHVEQEVDTEKWEAIK